MKQQMEKVDLIRPLFDCGAIKTGDFTFKSGIKSDLYCDMRQLYSFPKTLKFISKQLFSLVDSTNFDLICGVPLGAIPYATAMSMESNKPLIALRPERKDHGLCKMIEGHYEKGQRVLLVEDVTTTGSSINASAKQLEEHGLVVVEKLVIIDRRSDKTDNIKSLLTIEDIRDYSKKIRFNNGFAQRLWDIVQEKKTNICLSVDLDDLYQIINLLEDVGDHICMAKLHWDAFFYNINEDMCEIYDIATRKNFLILDDRKYNDIDSIVRKQYQNSETSDAVTVQSLFGQGTIDGIKDGVGIFLVAESSAKGNLIDETYTEKTIELAKANSIKVAGIVTQYRTDPSMLNLTPGIHLDRVKNGRQGYRTPREAVMNGSDILIIGRGIYNSEDPIKECIRYKEVGWSALTDRTKSKN